MAIGGCNSSSSAAILCQNHLQQIRFVLTFGCARRVLPYTIKQQALDLCCRRTNMRFHCTLKRREDGRWLVRHSGELGLVEATADSREAALEKM
jgi:hypothetical protein